MGFEISPINNNLTNSEEVSGVVKKVVKKKSAGKKKSAIKKTKVASPKKSKPVKKKTPVKKKAVKKAKVAPKAKSKKTVKKTKKASVKKTPVKTKKATAKKTTAKKIKKTAAKKSPAKKKAIVNKKVVVKKAVKSEPSPEIEPVEVDKPVVVRKSNKSINAIVGKIRERLLENRGEVLKMLESSQAMERDVDGLTFSNEIDLASSLEGREMVFHLSSRDRKELKLIDEALIKIENNTYGVCQSCEKMISVKRLQILPLTALCIECQESSEHH